MSGRSLKRVWKVPGRCLEGPDLIGLAQFGSGRYWVVSECCLDIMEGVWIVHLMCLESTCKVSGRCNVHSAMCIVQFETERLRLRD